MEALKKIVHMFFSNLTYHNLRKNFTKLRLYVWILLILQKTENTIVK